MNKNEAPHVPYRINPLPISSNWEDINIDIGEFQNMANPDEPNWRVLVIIDRFSKSLELAACYPDGESISRKIVKRVFQRHGIPATIMTDGAPYFQDEWKTFLEKWGIKHEHGDPYRHTTNGLAERITRTIRTWLRNNMLDEPEFKRRLAACQWSLNTAIAKSHGYTPFVMEHLREPRDVADNFLEPHTPGTPGESKTQNFTDARKIAHDRLELNRAKMIKQGQKPTTHKWEVGDLVYMRNLREPRTVEVKDSVQNQGPFIVSKYHKNASKIWLENPWVGIDSEFEIDKSSLIKGPEELPEKQPIDPKQQLIFENLKPAGKNAYKRIKKLLKVDTLEISDLVGHRIKVKWTGGALGSGWWPGKIVTYSPTLKKYWIKYDEPDSAGDHHFPQDLIAYSNWKFIDNEKQKPITGNGKRGAIRKIIGRTLVWIKEKQALLCTTNDKNFPLLTVM